MTSGLGLLELTEVGPSRHLRYEPSERLNLVTGDNSLGKTFLLDCLWWALTGQWSDLPAAPRRTETVEAPEVRFALHPDQNGKRTFSAKYDWKRQQWKEPVSVASEGSPEEHADRHCTELAIYSRHDS